jgi:Zn-dependent peptidase ImmA (M78 family)
MNDKQFNDNLSKLDAWAIKKRLEVCTGYGVDAYYHDERHVVYDKKLRQKKHQIYSLLHECGHALAFQSKQSYKNNFPTLHKHRFKEAKINKRRNLFKVETIIEEWDAWRRGFALSERLDLDLNQEDYYNYASRWVMTYVRRLA